jgi:hypothetical protein
LAHDAPADDSNFELFRRALIGELRYQTARRIRRPEVWIDDLIVASVNRGRLRARRALEALRRS